VTADVLRLRPWETVKRAMEDHLSDFSRRKFWFGFFYLASGAAPNLATREA
jgi:hypothetical protein